jgi:inorganic pyrophosphatase
MNKLIPAILLLIVGCAQGPAESPPAEEGARAADSDQYVLRPATSFLSGPTARADNGSIHVVVEIPAGTTDKWEVEKDGVMRREFKNGQPRVVKYLGYPGNYGMIPRTLIPETSGGDGDPLDVLVLAPAVERGSVVQARILGVLKMLDGGETDHKLIAVQEGTALSKAQNLKALDELFPGVPAIIDIWFSNYKGAGEIKSLGFSSIEEAERILDAGIKAYEAKWASAQNEAA